MTNTIKKVREEIENPTREQVAEWLKRISWNLHHHGANYYYFYNYKNENTGMRFCSDRIELPSKNWDETPDFVFYLKQLVMEMTDDDCISFRGKTDDDIFIQLRHYRE